eukprot:TRINITY_DN20522_c0_g1_i1.p1 TRINITY_DN20522_c0_g1~~TRINITY_DN20522_c0_g1_i1.p1  ORF type:complete len:184 (-),score=40.53 TRINITY_DN20522_c0_g1_i1:186-737(-)
MHPSIDSEEKFVEHFADLKENPRDPRFEPPSDDEIPNSPPPALGTQEDDPDDQSPWIPAGGSFFIVDIPTTVLLYSSLWGHVEDGPEVYLGEAVPEAVRPHSKSRGLPLPRLSHRSKLRAVNITDGKELGAWRVDAREGALRHFRLPIPPEELKRRKVQMLRGEFSRCKEYERMYAFGKGFCT